MPGTFAYDIPSNTITVTDGTELAPATFHDMFLADGVGGWGVVDEIVADSMYKIDCNISFGDVGETSTYFQSKREHVYIGADLKVKSNATLELGDLSGDWGVDGSWWSLIINTDNLNFCDGGNIYVYGSTLHLGVSKRCYFTTGNVDIRNSTLSGIRYSGGDWLNQYIFGSSMTSILFQRLTLSNMEYFYILKVPNTMENIHIHRCNYGLHTWANIEATNVLFTTITNNDVRLSSTSQTTIINPVVNLGTPTHNDATNTTIEQYTCNIHVADEDGADLETVSIACTTFGNVVSPDAGSTFWKCIVDHTSGVWATDRDAGKWVQTTSAYAALAGCAGGAGTGAWVTGIDYKKSATEFDVATNAAGDLVAEQTIDYKKWIGTSEALLTYSPHTFTLSYGGDTHVVTDFTVDAPVIWHLEFPPQATLLSAIYNKLPTNYMMGSDDVDDHNAELEDWADGGRLDVILDSTLSGVSNLANVGAAVNTPAKDEPDGFVITKGTNEGNDEDSTHALDGTDHTIDSTDSELDVYYEFDVGGDGVPTSVTVTGYLNGNNDNLEVYAYDWGNTEWNQIGMMPGTALTNNEVHAFNLFTSHVGTGDNLGLVHIRFTDGDYTLSSATLTVDQIYVSYSIVRRTAGYNDGAIWIDTNNGTAGTENFVNGTADNPVKTWADALTLSGNLKIKRFRIVNDSTITLTGDTKNYTMIGHCWVLALGGKDCTNSYFRGAQVTGTATITGTDHMHFEGCSLGDCTLAQFKARSCSLTGTITISAAVTYILDSCFAADTGGAAPPEIDFADVAATVGLRDYNGGIKVKTMASTSKFTYQGTGHLTIDATCDDGGTIGVNGCVILTDNVAGDGFAGTINQTSRYEHYTELNAIYDKLPDNYIMGSSDTEDHDDEIDTIVANTGKVVYGSVYTSAGVKKVISGGSVTGFVEDEKL